MTEAQQVALIDLDGTVANYNLAMCAGLNEIRSPGELELDVIPYGDVPDWLEARMDLIKAKPGFWRNLPIIRIGFEVCMVLERELAFKLMVLSKGPKRTVTAWTEKVEWAQTFLPNAGVTITYGQDRSPDKSLVYGKVLFDDFPPYIRNWLAHRPRGKVLKLDTPYNRDFSHPQVLRIESGPFLMSQQRLDIIQFITGATE